MNPILIFLLLYSIVLKVLPPKKPNYWYGYQLGSAKKSVAHWKLANSFAANGMIILYSVDLGLSLIFEWQQYDGRPLLLGLMITGLVAIYFLTERNLKRIDTTTVDV